MRTLLALLLVAATPIVSSAQSRPASFDDVLNIKAIQGASISPDGTQVIYTVRQWVSDQDRMEARTHVWKVSTDGIAPARQITFGERGDSHPQFSPDGKFISFLSARPSSAPGASGSAEARPQIYLMQADGGEAWKLTDAKEGVPTQGLNYSWSPDSTKIAFVTTDPRSAEEEANIKKRDDERVFEGDFRYSHAWVVDVATRAATRVTEGTNYTVQGAPSWSPDGKQFVFAAATTPMLRDNRRDVYLATLGGQANGPTGEQANGPTGGQANGPTGGQANGRTGGQANGRTGGQANGPTGGQANGPTGLRASVEKISTNWGSDGSPRWSPNGATIAWVSEPNTTEPLPDGTASSVIRQSRLMTYDVNARTIRDTLTPQFDSDAGTPIWTNEGTRVMWFSGKRAYNEAFA